MVGLAPSGRLEPPFLEFEAAFPKRVTGLGGGCTLAGRGSGGGKDATGCVSRVP